MFSFSTRRAESLIVRLMVGRGSRAEGLLRRGNFGRRGDPEQRNSRCDEMYYHGH